MTGFDTELVVESSAIALLTLRASEFLRNAGVDEYTTHHVALVLEEILNNLAPTAGALECRLPCALRLRLIG